MKNKMVKLFVFLALCLCIVGGILYWIHASQYESTDDAFLESDVIPISARVAGHVLAVHVVDNQMVEKDQLLAEIDKASFEARLEQANADIALGEAERERVSGDLRRYQVLLNRDEISKQKFANTNSELKSAEARLRAALARKREAELNLSYVQVKAPSAGKVTRKSVEPGAYVQVGQPLLALVSPKLWVSANFKETQIQHMKPGQAVSIHVDSLGKKFKGHVDSIQAGSGARFSLFPPENATGNFVKVVQRIPVKIVFDEATPDLTRLGPGLSVVPQVKIK